MRALGRTAWMVLSLAVVVGCGSSGYGTGQLTTPGKPGGDGPVQFTWSAGGDSTNGPISAVLPDGRVFSGRFMQVTSTTLQDSFGVGWAGAGWGGAGWGYGPGWGGYGWNGAYGPYDTYGYVRHYSGQVIAQLQGPEGEIMRCQFVLQDPYDGPEEGGLGECQISTGERIDYAMLRGQQE